MYCAVTNCVSTKVEPLTFLEKKEYSWSINNTKVTLLVARIICMFQNFFHEKCKLFARYETAVFREYF